MRNKQLVLLETNVKKIGDHFNYTRVIININSIKLIISTIIFNIKH